MTTHHPITPICEQNLIHAQTLGLEPETQKTLLDIFQSPKTLALAQEADRGFRALKDQDAGQRTVFANNFSAMHLSVMSVSALKIRIDRQADLDADTIKRIQNNLNSIIEDDVGLKGAPHHDLYERFAEKLTGTKGWRNPGHVCPQVNEFKTWLHVQRAQEHAPIENALATLIISEIWNTGEYTHAEPLTKNALEGKMDPQAARNANAYVAVHAGDTEFGHFLHAVQAFDAYCDARGIGKAQRLRILEDTAERYLEKLHTSFTALNAATQAPTASLRGMHRYAVA